MNWEQQDYSSFGYTNAPPLTPNKTPTAATFPSPSPVQTPQNNTNNFDFHSGWTPTFAEEYSVFNSTPGNLLDTRRPVLDAQGQQISNQQHRLSASEETFPPDFPPQYEQSNQDPKLPLPPVELSRRLSSSPAPPLSQPSNLPPTQPSAGVEKVTQKVTPRKTKGRLEETHSAQTATPPHTASRGIRRLAAKPTKPTKPTLAPSSMSQAQGFGHGSMLQNGLLDFSNTSMDMYGYPMSAPATAQGYSQGKSFWDPDSSMTGMDMDFGDSNHGHMEGSSHKHSNSLDWTRSNEIFQDTANNASFDMNTNRHSSLTQSKTYSHIESHEHSYEPDQPSSKANDFSSPVRTGVVDPGLLFSFPVVRNDFQSSQTTSDLGKVEVVRQPYQHQLRESMRDQEEEQLRRSRPSSQASFHSRDGRTYSSPTRRNPRASLQRSSSTSNSLQLQPLSQRSRDRSSRSRERRTSPVKNQSRTSLTSIPESAKFRTDNVPATRTPATRTDITFTIDANGRARTETTIIVSSDRQTLKRSASLANSRDWDDSQSESSSDEEIIIIPSRNSSFSLPQERRNSGQTHTTPRTTRLERSYSKRGRGTSVYSQSSGGDQSHRGGASMDNFEISHDPESEAETVVEPSDERTPSGDATSALRKVLDDRKRRSRQVMTDITPTKPRRGGRSSRFGGGGSGSGSSAWDGSMSTITTPSSNADGDFDTPSTDKSGVTRCVCGGFDSEGGFMIQCESCSKWLHAHCVNIDRRNIPHVYICTFCTFTPTARGRSLRDGGRGGNGGRNDSVGGFASSPLMRKSFR